MQSERKDGFFKNVRKTVNILSDYNRILTGGFDLLHKQMTFTLENITDKVRELQLKVDNKKEDTVSKWLLLIILILLLVMELQITNIANKLEAVMISKQYYSMEKTQKEEEIK